MILCRCWYVLFIGIFEWIFYLCCQSFMIIFSSMMYKCIKLLTTHLFRNIFVPRCNLMPGISSNICQALYFTYRSFGVRAASVPYKIILLPLRSGNKHNLESSLSLASHFYSPRTRNRNDMLKCAWCMFGGYSRNIFMLSWAIYRS